MRCEDITVITKKIDTISSIHYNNMQWIVTKDIISNWSSRFLILVILIMTTIEKQVKTHDLYNVLTQKHVIVCFFLKTFFKFYFLFLYNMIWWCVLRFHIHISYEIHILQYDVLITTYIDFKTHVSLYLVSDFSFQNI